MGIGTSKVHMTFPTSRIDETINSATGRLESGDDVRKTVVVDSPQELNEVVDEAFLVLGNCNVLP
jgi:hypothetical protein